MNIDHRDTSHPGKEQLLYHFAGTYECIFNILHPLVRIPGLPGGNPWHDKFRAEKAKLNCGVLSPELIQKIDAIPSLDDGHVVLDREIFEQLEKQSGECVSWKTFSRRCGISSIYSLVQGLYGACTGSGDKQLGAIVNSALLEEALYLPMLGGFPFVLENRILDVFKAFGIEEITLAHELFEEKTVDMRVRDFSRDEQWFPQTNPLFCHNTGYHRIFDPELKVLFLVDSDSFCSVVCLKSKAMKDVVDIPSLFDGFWCDETTTGYWFMREDAPWN